jgi:transposase, IS5 family
MSRSGVPDARGVSAVKRRHGLSRCRYKGPAGMERWVGLGVIADNLINIGRVMRRRSLNKPWPSSDF